MNLCNVFVLSHVSSPPFLPFLISFLSRSPLRQPTSPSTGSPPSPQLPYLSPPVEELSHAWRNLTERNAAALFDSLLLCVHLSACACVWACERVCVCVWEGGLFVVCTVKHVTAQLPHSKHQGGGFLFCHFWSRGNRHVHTVRELLGLHVWQAVHGGISALAVSHFLQMELKNRLWSSWIQD